MPSAPDSSFPLDAMRDAQGTITAPGYVEDRIRRPAPERCFVVPASTPVVAFGNPGVARVATLGLNPSRIEFEIKGVVTRRAGSPLRDPAIAGGHVTS